MDKRRAKKAEQAGSVESGETKESPVTAAAAEGDKDKAKEKTRARYRQREVVDRASGLEKKGMDSVLGSVFG